MNYYESIAPNESLTPCIIKGKEGHWLFHCWSAYSNPVPPSMLMGGHLGGQVSCVLGICEDENGQIYCFPPEKICMKRNKEFYERYAMGNFDDAQTIPEKSTEEKKPARRR